MGGASTEVSPETTRVAFESAWFDPATVRATSRALGLKTEAAARFERGSDSAAPVAALARALALLASVGAGQQAGPITDVCVRTPEPRRLTLRADRLTRVLGVEVPPADVERLLRRLAFTLTAASDGWHVEVPSFRVDVTREADLIEEVGRHWGFDRIPARFPGLTELPRPMAPAVSLGRRVRRLLCGAGLQEAVTFTFIEAAAAAPFLATEAQVVITNPLSEKFAVLRPSLAPGLLDSLEYNRNRQAAAVRLFEVGSVFSTTRGERPSVGWVLAGPRQVHWSERPAIADFSDTKGLAELLASALGAAIDVAPADDRPWLVSGQRATVLAGGTDAGWIGRLAGTDPAADPIFAGELDLDVLTRAGAARPTAILPLPRFPSSVRDISILVDERLPAERVRGTIRSSAPPTLVSIREFDRYQGKGVPDGQVSLSIRLTFQRADRTLLDADVQQAVDAVIAALAREHHATLRGQ
jgi:phenylalanyl-tRNA synthetase beta chain